MYLKFIKFVLLFSLLVCCGFAGRVLYSRFFNLVVQRERSTSHTVGRELWLASYTLLAAVP